jgi:SAM-dependent methyltransferase
MAKQRFKALNIGCGDQRMPSTINVDKRPDSGAEVIHDLEVFPWPFRDEEFDYVYAIDIIEHLDDVIGTVAECHRILKPRGILEIKVPHWQAENHWIDPTHKHGFHPMSFNYFDPETELGRKYWYYTRAKFEILDNQMDGQEIHIKMAKREPNELAEKPENGGG